MLAAACGGNDSGSEPAPTTAAAAAETPATTAAAAKKPGMTFELPPLPYPEGALAPHVSARTLSFHYGRHHAGYVAKLAGLVDGTDHENSTLEEIVTQTGPGALFNNAAQAWNHDFYWHSMSPAGGGDPAGALAEAVDGAFGSADAFKEEFAAAARSKFGSGWVWLTAAGDSLRIEATDNADTPLAHGLTPLLTIDVWEHAYYLDYQNDRAAYVDAFIEHLIDWDSAAARFAA